MLKIEMESKKVYTADYDTYCNMCGEVIPESYDFVFLGKGKVCQDCQGEIIEHLEYEIAKL